MTVSIKDPTASSTANKAANKAANSALTSDLSRERQHDLEHAALSQRILQWRRERNLSQAELAEKAGFARSTLSKIENGQLSPTFEILLKLAKGFEVDITSLLASDPKPGLAGRLCIDRGDGEARLTDANNRLIPLAREFKDKKLQSFVVEFTCFDLTDFGPWNSHETEDLLYVLSGELEFHSEGYETVRLTAGQSLYYDGRMRHACLSVGEEVCRCLYAFANPETT
ncbi:helix-turn-helix domain-containing protein [Rhodovibrionaceae bacterium A322]